MAQTGADLRRREEEVSEIQEGRWGGVMGAWPEDWGAGEARWEAVEFGHKGVAVTCW